MAAISKEARPRYELQIQVDSAKFSKAVVDTAISHGAVFTITAEQNEAVRRAIDNLSVDPDTV